jgi:calcineurin-like phosphoesterase family protein
MSRVWITADEHFGHQNCLRYCLRPFETAAEMDKEIIKRWNNVVAKTDKIFVLGDFSFYGQEKTRQICEELHGDKTLILGNHDRHPAQWYRDVGFKEVYKYPILYAERYL